MNGFFEFGNDIAFVRGHGRQQADKTTPALHACTVVQGRPYVEVAGFDARMGAQDIARGVQVTVALGRTVGGGTRGNVAAGHLFVGAGGATNFVGLSILSEGQRRGSELADAVVSGRLAHDTEMIAAIARRLGVDDGCHRYVKAVAVLAPFGWDELLEADLATADLDLIAVERGNRRD